MSNETPWNIQVLDAYYLVKSFNNVLKFNKTCIVYNGFHCIRNYPIQLCLDYKRYSKIYRLLYKI